MSQWQTLLQGYAITLSEDQNCIISASESSESTRIIPLLHQRVISVIGTDAEKFLQGQLTCNVKEANELGSRLGAHCNVKGSMLALYRLIAIEGGFWLRLHHETAVSGLNNLKKYIIFSKATANDESDSVLGLGLMGAGASTLVEKLFDRVPTEIDKSVRAGNKVAIKVPGDRFEVWMPANEISDALEVLLKFAPFGTTNDWICEEIKAAIPDLRASTQEHFIPQMSNLQALKGVSFNKGCYTGQEIVTRLQHRGKLNKPMYLASVEANQQINAGDIIDSAEKEGIGEVLLAAQDSDRTLLLAVITKAQADEHALMLANNKSPITLLELPYELDPELFVSKR